MTGLSFESTPDLVLVFFCGFSTLLLYLSPPRVVSANLVLKLSLFSLASLLFLILLLSLLLLLLFLLLLLLSLLLLLLIKILLLFLVFLLLLFFLSVLVSLLLLSHLLALMTNRLKIRDSEFEDGEILFLRASKISEWCGVLGRRGGKVRAEGR